MGAIDIIIAALVVSGLLVFFIWLFGRLGFSHIETEERKAGRRGEKFAAGIIREILRDGDVLITNRHLLADGMVTELDNVVINSYGVFIIEVKNYFGLLVGEEGDDEWIITQSLSSGVFRQKTVKNPIKQVKRQADILGRYFRQYDIACRIKGYVFFVQMNSPIKSPYVLKTQRDMDTVLHTSVDEVLPSYVQKEIAEVLKRHIETLKG